MLLPWAFSPGVVLMGNGERVALSVLGAIVFCVANFFALPQSDEKWSGPGIPTTIAQIFVGLEVFIFVVGCVATIIWILWDMIRSARSGW